MTVASNSRENIYDADGMTVSFPWTFPVSDAGEVRVFAIIDGVAAEITSGITKNPTGGVYPAPGGNVVFADAPEDGQIWVYGDTPVSQLSAIPQNATLYSAGVEGILDKAYRIMQEIRARLARIPQSSNPDASISLPDPTNEPDGRQLGVIGGVYAFLTQVVTGALTIAGDALGRIPVWSGTLGLTSFSHFVYNSITNTLRLRGNADGSNLTLDVQGVGGTTVASIRSDGVETDPENLTTKGYVDGQIGNVTTNAHIPSAILAGAGFDDLLLDGDDTPDVSGRTHTTNGAKVGEWEIITTSVNGVVRAFHATGDDAIGVQGCAAGPGGGGTEGLMKRSDVILTSGQPVFYAVRARLSVAPTTSVVLAFLGLTGVESLIYLTTGYFARLVATSAQANWQFECRNNAATSSIDTGFAKSSDWFWAVFRSNPGVNITVQLGASLEDALAATPVALTSNIPTAPVRPMLGIAKTAGGSGAVICLFDSVIGPLKEMAR